MEISKNKRAILYLRFSDPKQIGGTSIETQKKICLAACETEGFDVIEIVENEAISANKTNTQRVAELLEFCKERQNQFDILLVYKLDRFARSQEQHHWLRGQLLKMGILLRSATEKVDESPSGRLVEGVLAAVNEYDNEVKKERVKLAMWRRVDEGLWPWQPPVGYAVNKTLNVKLSPHVLDSNCSQAVKDIFLKYSAGLSSKTEIANEFNKRRLKNYKGKALEFPNETIHNILNNIYYTGYVKHQDGRLIKGKHEALIDHATYEKCQMVQNKLSNNAITKRSRNNPDFPLRRFVACAFCGTPLTACWSKSESGKKHAYYYCRNNECASFSKMIKKSDLENDFSRFLSSVKPTEDYIERFHQRFIKRYELREKEIRGEYWNQVELLKKLEAEEKNVIAMGRKGIIPEHRVKEQVEELEKTLTLEKFRLTEMHGEELDINALLAYAYDFIRTVENVWCDAIPEVKIRLQRFIFPKGVNYDSTGFSNSTICPLFKQIRLIGSETPSLVTPRGLEPRFLE